MKAWRFKIAVVTVALTLTGSVYAFHSSPDQGFDWSRSQTSVLRVAQDTIVSGSLLIMRKMVLIHVQDDNEAFYKIIFDGLISGRLELLKEGQKVFWVKGVDKDIMLIRPKGSDNIYYAFRTSFETITPGEAK